MAKKVNRFAGDFQNISQSADDKVIAFLKQNEKEKEDAEKTPAPMKEEPVTAKVKTEVAEKDTEAEKEKVQPKIKTPQKKETKPKLRSINVQDWGKPVALFNTRIPEKMAELLDDLAYKRKKEGRPCTKQAIAIEAIESYLKQEGVLKSA